MRGWIFAGLLALLPGCGLITADRPTVQQGNILAAEDLAQLEPGLSRARVRELIGNPVLHDRMHPDRWDYIYYRTEGGMGVADPQRLTLYFEGNRLARIVDRYRPPGREPIDVEARPLPESGRPAPADGPPPRVPGPGSPGSDRP